MNRARIIFKKWASNPLPEVAHPEVTDDAGLAFAGCIDICKQAARIECFQSCFETAADPGASRIRHCGYQPDQRARFGLGYRHELAAACATARATGNSPPRSLGHGCFPIDNEVRKLLENGKSVLEGNLAFRHNQFDLHRLVAEHQNDASYDRRVVLGIDCRKP